MRTFAALQTRLAAVQGVRFEELARAHSMEWPDDIRRAKGTAGRLVELVLGMENPDNRPSPDLTDLGLEIKTVPICTGLRPLEPTKITSLNYADVSVQPWESSAVLKKLRSVLFVPVVKPDNNSPADWYVRSPFVWMPSTSATATFRGDYEEVQAQVRTNPESLSSARPPKGQGVYLTAKTSGRDALDVVHYDLDGDTMTGKRRGWFLRKDFVEKVLIENILYQASTP